MEHNSTKKEKHEPLMQHAESSRVKGVELGKTKHKNSNPHTHKHTTHTHTHTYIIF